MMDAIAKALGCDEPLGNTEPGAFAVPSGAFAVGSNPDEATLFFRADLGLRIFDAQVDLNLGVRNSQFQPVGFSGIVEGAEIDNNGSLWLSVRSPNLEAPDYYGGPKWVMSVVKVDGGLFAPMGGAACKQRPNFQGKGATLQQYATGAQVTMANGPGNPSHRLQPLRRDHSSGSDHRQSAAETAAGDRGAEGGLGLRAESEYPEGLPDGGQHMAGFEWQQDISWDKHVQRQTDDGRFSDHSETGAGSAFYLKVFDSAARHPHRNGGWRTKIEKRDNKNIFQWVKTR